ncbi:hypothetical protein K438DRAFT_1987680 [Mycena galopus ATCC 62051]|nr:hypothetical protein K438DRAFT_1987680 [Mycena galopus ATCC 62051]
MPETRETTGSGKQAQMEYQTAKAAGASFVLENIAVDATKAEAKRSDASREAKDGLVYILDATSAIKRGQNHHQTHVYPPQLRVTTKNPDPPPLSTLVLEKITYTHRALILHFGTLFLMIQYLTHTSVQFYPRERWEKVRKFNIGMALIFSDHVLAFPSIDLVFQPTWATSLDDFNIPPNIYTSTVDFLDLVADWIEESFKNPTSAGPAMKSVIATIYSTVSVWLSPFLTLYEVFSVPSRAARFLLVFYSYIDRSERDLWSLLEPSAAIRRLALCLGKRPDINAPSDGVIGDEYNSMLEDLSRLDSMWSRSDVELFDDSWLSSGGELSENDDPLTALYRKYDLLGSPTKLKPTNFYSPLILPHAEFRGKNSSHRPTFAFHDPKEMWSVTRSFPPNSHWTADSEVQANILATMPRELLGTDRTTRLIKYIITNTLKVSIGPLEYCGVGHIVHIGGLPRVAVCKGDPEIPRLHELRVMRGLNRVTSALDKPGKSKRSRTEKENKSLAKKLSVIDIGYERAGKSIEATDNIPTQEPRVKKRRISADQKLALAYT